MRDSQTRCERLSLEFDDDAPGGATKLVGSGASDHCCCFPECSLKRIAPLARSERNSPLPLQLLPLPMNRVSRPTPSCAVRKGQLNVRICRPDPDQIRNRFWFLQCAQGLGPRVPFSAIPCASHTNPHKMRAFLDGAHPKSPLCLPQINLWVCLQVRLERNSGGIVLHATV
jgi:hypothetical protein